MPALMKPLLDHGFNRDTFNPWLVPAALLLLFGIRGSSGFIADVALAKIANEGMFSLRRALFAYPLMTLKVTAAIHWEAMKLWLKGVPYLRRKPAAARIATTIVD